MGFVYEAEDLQLGRRVALKFLRSDRLGSGHGRERMLREARAAASLNHPNICTIYEIGEYQNELFLAMEYCQGQPFSALIREGSLKPDTAIRIAVQIGEALAEAHRRQITHRDVKSGNIIVDGGYRAKLLDFGLASLTQGDDATLTVEFSGTPAYMAPERFQHGISDPRGDVWALGVILYEALTGKMPFSGDLPSLIYAILHSDPSPIATHIPGLPDALETILARSLSKDPSKRYPSAIEQVEDLRVLARMVSTEAPPGDAGKLTRKLSSATETAAAVTGSAVAVLPFVILSRSSEDEFLGEGFAEEITNALTQVRGLRVASRASTFRFRSAALDAAQIGRQLRVAWLVLGSLRREGERLRVSAQLVNSATGYQVWSQRFESQMRSLFEIEDQVTAAVVQQLRNLLGSDLEVERTRGGTSHFDAHALYLRGRHAFNLQTAQSLTDALRFFSEALALSPDYALARVAMADCYAVQGWYGMAPSLEVMPKAKAYLDEALAIEDKLPSAWCLSAVIAAGFDWNWGRARTEFQKAFACGSTTAVLHFHHALDYLTPLGQLDEALEEMKVALRLDPAAPLISTGVGGCLYRLRRYASALRQLEAAVEMAPDFYHAHSGMGRVLEAMGRHSQAIACYERALSLSGDNPAALADSGHCLAAMGDKAGAQQILLRLPASPVGRAIVHMGLGETDLAIQQLRVAVNERARGVTWLGVDQRFDAIRHQPPFRELMDVIFQESSGKLT